MKPLANCFKWGGEGGDGGGKLTNVQCKAIWKCHNESPLYNAYILINWEKYISKQKKMWKNCLKNIILFGCWEKAKD
jgi:hypothetical protein